MNTEWFLCWTRKGGCEKGAWKETCWSLDTQVDALACPTESAAVVYEVIESGWGDAVQAPSSVGGAEGTCLGMHSQGKLGTSYLTRSQPRAHFMEVSDWIKSSWLPGAVRRGFTVEAVDWVIVRKETCVLVEARCEAEVATRDSCWGGAGRPVCVEDGFSSGWAAVSGVARSRTWLKRLSSSSSSVLYLWKGGQKLQDSKTSGSSRSSNFVIIGKLLTDDHCLNNGRCHQCGDSVNIWWMNFLRVGMCTFLRLQGI